MKNFQLMARDVNITALMNQVARNKQLWNANDIRTKFPGSPHKEVDDIWIRFNDTGVYDKDRDMFVARTGGQVTVSSIADDHESINYEAFHVLSEAQDLIFNLMRVVKGERLGRVLVTRLAPGGRIAPHVDGGAHAEYYDRYHLVLMGYPGSIFRCGDEQVQMLSGEVWWFDNAVEHEVINNSADDRIHIVIDIRTAHK